MRVAHAREHAHALRCMLCLSAASLQETSRALLMRSRVMRLAPREYGNTVLENEPLEGARLEQAVSASNALQYSVFLLLEKVRDNGVLWSSTACFRVSG